MKKIYIVPTVRLAPFCTETYLTNLSANTYSGASGNGGSAAGSGGSFSTGEGSVGSGDFSKRRGFYSGFED